MRGEQSSAFISSASLRGSPPLARGTALMQQEVAQQKGITPACAGNRRSPACICHSARDHPRLRGEQSYRDVEAKCGVGSPPLARGTASEAKKEWKRIGITPACAGNSMVQAAVMLYVRDHPRLRGEQDLAISRRFGKMGSPPLARGTG